MERAPLAVRENRDVSTPPARPSTSSARTRTPALDAQCAAAIDLARAAAEDIAGADAVGAHQRVIAEADRVVTHVFACQLPGYRGWEWAVTVARASRSRDVTISETVLLPGEGALLAPEWLPWSERIQPGDLSVGEILPTAEDDPRLDPGYVTQPRDVLAGGEAEAEPDLDPPAVVAYELGLGRAHVLSAYGRDDATTPLVRGRPRTDRAGRPGRAGPVLDLRLPRAARPASSVRCSGSARTPGRPTTGRWCRTTTAAVRTPRRRSRPTARSARP